MYVIEGRKLGGKRSREGTGNFRGKGCDETVPFEALKHGLRTNSGCVTKNNQQYDGNRFIFEFRWVSGWMDGWMDILLGKE